GLADRFHVDSAGTHGYHIGEAPDSRSVKAASKRGIDISTLRARKVLPEDFHGFDLILALDNGHFRQHELIRPSNGKAQLALFLPHAGTVSPTEVPDPYYRKPQDFEYVLDLIEAAAL